MIKEETFFQRLYMVTDFIICWICVGYFFSNSWRRPGPYQWLCRRSTRCVYNACCGRSTLVSSYTYSLAGRWTSKNIVPREHHDEVALYVLVFAIGISGWVQYARTVRGQTLVEKGKEYVQAARVIGIRKWTILLRHILPNVTGPVLVIATIHLAIAIITEATLSFLGVGVPPTTPSLGTLIRIGNDFLFSGEWWITIFPGVALVLLVLAVNLLGDWLRDALNPKLR